jgi:hypothetical protein
MDCQSLQRSIVHPEGVHGSRRGSGTGRAVCDDPRVAVEPPLVLSESQREIKEKDAHKVLIILRVCRTVHKGSPNLSNSHYSTPILLDFCL